MNYRMRLYRRICRYFPEWLLVKIINHKTRSLQYPVVFMFHHVLPLSQLNNYLVKYNHLPNEVEPYSLTPQKFEEILLILKDMGYTFDYEDGFKKRKGKVAIISFDDGYSDNYIYAFPILQKLGIKASINLIANDICDSEDDEFLSKTKIRLMQDSDLIQFQAHTVSHPNLTQCSDDECRKEVLDSKRIILEKTGIETSVFVYPYAQSNASIERIVKENYILAYGGDDYNMDLLYRIPRIEIDKSINKKEFLQKVLVYYYTIE